MATFAVASFVLVAYTVIVSGEPGPPGRRHGDGNRRKPAHGWLIEVAKALTTSARPRSSWPLATIARGDLAARRRWAEWACSSPAC